MSPVGAERRLAAILAADVVGYSRQMGADEAGTLARIRALKTEVLEPLLAEHGGRLFKTMGDGFLAEFSSAVNALACAIAVQVRLAGTETQLRVGLHAGDVVVDGEDLFGDGVNIAARLEPLAEPGSIVISARIREDARGKIDIAPQDMGEQHLKNIADPVRVFRIPPPNVSARATPSASAATDKPSIAVLPFANMSGDAEQEYFADGVAEDIITELSRARALFVIARNSSFTYRGRAVDIKQVGRELGVSYVLEGSVRRAGNRIRVTAQLIEALSGTHVWAERYDRDLTDVFAVQDEITGAIIAAIHPSLDAAEQQRVLRKPVASLGAWETYQLALWHMARLTPDDNTKAAALLRHAIAMDPGFGTAVAALSRTICISAQNFRLRPLREAGQEAETLARQAVALDSLDPVGHVALCHSLLLQEKMDAGKASALRALDLSPNLGRAHRYLGVIHIHNREPQEGRAALQMSLRLDPRDIGNVGAWDMICVSYLQEAEYESCVASCREVEMHYSAPIGIVRWQLVALVHLHRHAEARELLSSVMASERADLFRKLIGDRPPWIALEDHADMLDCLRQVGWKD